MTSMQQSYSRMMTVLADAARTLPSFGLPLVKIPWLHGVSVLIVALVALPLVYLALRALGAGEAGLEYLLRPRTLDILLNSLALVVAVVVGSALIGVPLAWLTARTDVPLRRVWLILGLLPMVIPSFIGALTLVEVFGPRGMLQSLLEPLGVRALPPIYGFFGAWLTITLFTYPYFMLPVRAALMNADPALEEAARSMGLGRWRVFWRVTLPQFRLALLSGGLLTALYTLSDFGAVMVMKYNAFTRAIYVAYNNSFDRERAAILALVLVVLTLVLLVAQHRAAKLARPYRASACAKRRPVRVKLGLLRLPSLLFCLLVTGLGVGLPVLVLTMWTLNPNVTSAVDVDLTALSLNTIGISLLTALVVAAAALPLAHLATVARSRFTGALVGVAYLGNVLPGIVISLALVYFAANYTPALYQTIPILLLGYASRFLPYSLSSTRDTLAQLNPRLMEAARSLGSNARQTALRVTIPLARTGILAGAALVFLSAMKELPTTLILAPIGFRTLATRIWTAQENGTLTLIGLPGLLLLLASCAGLAIVLWSEKRRLH
jgi:iron(III) transport system permease protein